MSNTSTTTSTLPITPAEDVIISEEDMNHARGSNELKACPFCGRWALSCGEINRSTGNTVYRVMCTNQLKCSASTFSCSKNALKARAEAIRQWNERVPIDSTILYAAKAAKEINVDLNKEIARLQAEVEFWKNTRTNEKPTHQTG
jgi:hypothetical protein